MPELHEQLTSVLADRFLSAGAANVLNGGLYVAARHTQGRASVRARQRAACDSLFAEVSRQAATSAPAYDALPDGNRFVMMRRAGGVTTMILLDWTERLQRTRK